MSLAELPRYRDSHFDLLFGVSFVAKAPDDIEDGEKQNFADDSVEQGRIREIKAKMGTFKLRGIEDY